MIDVASAKINSFAPVPQNDNVSQSEDPVFFLTSSQLQDVITRALLPLQDEIETLKATVTRQDEKITALESTQERDVDRLALDIAYDRQRIAKLEHKEPEDDSPLLDELYKEMVAIGRKQTDFATAASVSS